MSAAQHVTQDQVNALLRRIEVLETSMARLMAESVWNHLLLDQERDDDLPEEDM